MVNSLNAHAGHGCQKSKSPGTSGIFKESEKDREVLSELFKLLDSSNKTYYNTTVDYPNSQSDCLNKIVALCNQHKVDLDISIHFNASKDKKGEGVECWVYSTNSEAYSHAKDICNEISKLGFKNRGVKTSSNFAVLKTKNPNIIIECCFCDNPKDVEKFNAKEMALAIYRGIYKCNPVKPQEKPKFEKGILYSSEADLLSAKIIWWEKSEYQLINIKDHYLWQCRNLIVVGGATEKVMKEKFPQEKYTFIGGKDRFETIRKCLDYVGK